jgi:ABC-type glycerol-3-phosphate transport system substrate-binding protein
MRQTRSPGLRRALAVLGAAALIVTACSGSAASQAPATPASQAPATLASPAASQGGQGAGTTITIAVSSSPSATALRAMGDAFAKETGGTVKFVDLPYSDIAAKGLSGN